MSQVRGELEKPYPVEHLCDGCVCLGTKERRSSTILVFSTNCVFTFCCSVPAMVTFFATSLCVSTAPQLLASRQAQLSGSSLICSSTQQPGASIAGPVLVQPRASRRCDLTGKKANNGYKVSFSNKRTKHLQQPNLQYKKLWWEEGNRFVQLRISTKALKTVEKNGLQAMAKKAGVNLADH